MQSAWPLLIHFDFVCVLSQWNLEKVSFDLRPGGLWAATELKGKTPRSLCRHTQRNELFLTKYRTELIFALGRYSYRHVWVNTNRNWFSWIQSAWPRPVLFYFNCVLSNETLKKVFFDLRPGGQTLLSPKCLRDRKPKM